MGFVPDTSPSPGISFFGMHPRFQMPSLFTRETPHESRAIQFTANIPSPGTKGSTHGPRQNALPHLITPVPSNFQLSSLASDHNSHLAIGAVPSTTGGFQLPSILLPCTDHGARITFHEHTTAVTNTPENIDRPIGLNSLGSKGPTGSVDPVRRRCAYIFCLEYLDEWNLRRGRGNPGDNYEEV
ncbi:hypothetical protein CC78DRAFT_579047 [Lojkania enalia]|uniref:Uncharacterized protein n=1 Tax=Lojkania enalia TaxID=147567 RepID=A0A9P4KFM0_9PLEO|nr:hypothetical protein CC78DRAFT_579047 [Didymosphaeria enalia]